MKTPVLLLAMALAAAPAFATDVTVIGLFPGKAVVTIDRGSPKTLSVGERTAEGVLLVSVDARGATVEIDGKRQLLEMGQHFETAAMTSGRTSVTLAQDGRGHFRTDAQVNGAHIRFMVDTGATLISIPMNEAQRLGIEYAKGSMGYMVLADGRRVAAYRVTLESVSIGELTLYNVDAVVTPGSGEPLLGMSFLSRTEMRNDGQSLVLTKRY
ncbi:MAG TPA: TIGR02281 family clan AA aspartic protease [Usitatibacter sp.]|nr:TIGR02281 family clan AA aspartic protease [Usitatibacter sp.]